MIMSTISSYDDALDFMPKAKTATGRRGFLSTIRLVLDALREGHAAERRYHELTVHGVPHEEAARRVFLEVYSAN
jgi:hypothetical protein